MQRTWEVTLAMAAVTGLALGPPTLGVAADVTSATTMLTTLLGSATSWSSQIIVAMLVLGLVVISMTHFADLRQVLAIPLTIAIIAALVVYSPTLVTAVGLVAGAPVDEVVLVEPQSPPLT